jgi:SNF2 family DNA or RNA helicase
MGLGKTVQALALLLHRAPNGAALVIAPTSVGINWQREAARFAPSLRVVLFRGSKALAGLEGLGPNDVVVTSYDLVVRNMDRLKAIEFDTLVLDEAQAIKNPTTRRARAVFALDRRFTLALTGTPVENRASELWSLFRAVAPGYLGSVDHFREQFIRPLETGDEDARRALAGSVRPFILRRLKSEVARDLPPRSDVRIDVELSEKERALYEQLRKSVVAELDPQNKVESVEPRDRRFQVLAALTHLRRLASDPRLVYPETRVVSSKLTVLRSLLSELRAEGHRALVFSQFTSLLAHVREILDGESVPYEYLDGSTPVKKRMAAVDAFQAGRSDLFLLSVKAGGTGLNLTAADYVIHLDPWWNPAIEDQATDRAHRIGQTNPVTVYRMVALGTVEETIYDLHHTKRELVAALLAGTDSSAPLKTEDLMELLTSAHR